MSPPGLMAPPVSGRTTQAATREALLRDAIRLMTVCGVVRSHAWTRQVVRDYFRATIHGLPFGQYLAARLELNAQERADMLACSEFARVISYADPTGETAVRNVMSARPWTPDAGAGAE